MDVTLSDEQKLFEYIRSIRQQQAVQVGDVSERIDYYKQRGKDVEWFQCIVPELIPGTESSSAWVDGVRETLWNEENRKEHKRICMLQAHSPQTLPPDKYNLRKYWPAYVESLRPMSPELLEAANHVYQVVARRDCLLDHHNRPRQTEDMDTKHHHFVAVSQVVQDLLVSPVIRKLRCYLDELGREIVTLDHELKDLTNMSEDAHEKITKNLHEKQIRRKRLEAERTRTRDLEEALKRFRMQIAKEREDRDNDKNLKRQRGPKSPDVGNTPKRLSLGEIHLGTARASPSSSGDGDI